eukprot:TRINITY_DN1828_c0_g2_i2.p1 TRINITY_DN1828_c0_g2~~TRINITY_DN1828_c0_g2_i2.p1  ORF type:complete len:189 (-),score=37.77 TRINITY_DN1828_c0_g2_i2:22-588(-)
MIRRPPRSTQGVSSAASDVYKRQVLDIDPMELSEPYLLIRMLLSEACFMSGNEQNESVISTILKIKSKYPCFSSFPIILYSTRDFFQEELLPKYIPQVKEYTKKKSKLYCDYINMIFVSISEKSYESEFDLASFLKEILKKRRIVFSQETLLISLAARFSMIKSIKYSVIRSVKTLDGDKCTVLASLK